VSESSQPGASESASQNGVGEVEEIDGLPVLASAPRALDARSSERALSGEQLAAGIAIPAVRAAAVAAGGFVAGAAVVGLVHRRQRHAALRAGRLLARNPGGRRNRRGVSPGELVQIVGSRSLLLDVHLLGGSGGQR